MVSADVALTAAVSSVVPVGTNLKVAASHKKESQLMRALVQALWTRCERG